jgi:hypothetical protein
VKTIDIGGVTVRVKFRIFVWILHCNLTVSYFGSLSNEIADGENRIQTLITLMMLMYELGLQLIAFKLHAISIMVQSPKTNRTFGSAHES